MNNRRLSYGSSYAGPAPVNVAPAQPLQFSSIGQFSGPSPQYAKASTMGMPTGNPGAVGNSGISATPTTVGDFGMSTMGSTGSMMGPNSSLFDSDGGIAMAPQSAAAGGGGGGLFGDFFGSDGFNIGDLGEISKIIGGFGNLYMGMQQNKLAKKSLKAQKEAYKNNLANQIASFNLSLEDRMQSRYRQANGTEAEAQAAIDKHKL